MPVKVVGATPYTDRDDNGAEVQGVRAQLASPVEKDGKKYNTLKTTWSVIVKTLLDSGLQQKFSEGAQLPVKAVKAPGKRYYILTKP